MDSLHAWLTLVRAPGLHAGHLRELLPTFSDAGALLAAASRDDRLPEAARRWLRSPDSTAIAADIAWLQQPAHHFISLDHPLYPALLTDIPDAPPGLFVRGDPTLLGLPQLAMVGSRNPTTPGRETARQFAAHLATAGLGITSGLASGIDAASHQGALDVHGITIAVCGTGLDIIYPRSNAALAESIAASGALVSEFPTGTPGLPANFPRRNRLIAGLSLGTLVVEAAVHSGSLITARLAGDYGREVFAIPGSIHNPMARGCHRLIRQGAKLVETAEDIFSEVGALAGRLARELQARPATSRQPLTGGTATASQALSGPARKGLEAPGNSPPALDKDYEILLDALGFEPASVDVLIARTGLKADEVASMLLILELEGRIDAGPGGQYVRVPKAAT